MKRVYALMLDRGPKPWVTGYSREMRYREYATIDRSSRTAAVAYFQREYADEIRDAAGWAVRCLGAEMAGCR